MNIGELLTPWTIRLALVCYFLGLAGLLLARERPRLQSPARLCWTVGCLFYLLHVFSASHFHHDWSHQAAVLDTARQTKDLFDTEFGSGIYMSYLFTVVWTLDTCWWWLAGHTRYQQRSKAFATTIHIFMLFIVANGAIVFEEGPVRWLSTIALVWLGSLWWRRKIDSGNAQ